MLVTMDTTNPLHVGIFTATVLDFRNKVRSTWVPKANPSSKKQIDIRTRTSFINQLILVKRL